MPEFVDVASYFDNETAYDAYSGVAAFQGQFNTFIETAVIGSTERRRTMSVRPGTALPLRRAISINGEKWLIGNGNTDSFFNTPVRTAYWLKYANQAGALVTPGGYFINASGTEVLVSLEYEKDTTDSLTTSEYDTFWRAYLSATESAPRGTLIVMGPKLLRVRASHVELGGFLMAQCDELIDPGAVNMTVQGAGPSQYDPVTDSYVSGTKTIKAIVFDMYKLYRYDTKADTRMGQGDRAALVPESVAVGSTVSINSQDFRVVSSAPELDAFALHLTRK